MRLIITFLFFAVTSYAQDFPYRIGERITYTVSFEKAKEAAYVEFSVASQGKYKNEDVIELRTIIRTTGLLSTIYPIDQTRVCLVSLRTGLPVYNRIVSKEEALPKIVVQDFPTAYHNLVTAFYQVRFGLDNLVFQEGEKAYSLSWQIVSKEKVRTDIGDFETVLVQFQSDFFKENDIRSLQINITEDENRLPVLIRFRTKRGSFVASMASFQMLSSERSKEIITPQPSPQPTPQVTSRSHLENQPLPEDLPFSLGETLTFSLSLNDQKLVTVVLQAKERRLFKGKDSILLKAEVLEENPAFPSGSAFSSWVDPFFLVPYQFEANLSGSLSKFNQVIEFDQENGFFVNLLQGIRSEMPIGTHSVLSLAYAIRTFRIEYQKNLTRDVRTAVFWDKKYYIVTLRPISQEKLEVKGKKLDAVVVSISTGNPTIDRLNMRVWLSNDDLRLPLRFVVGNYKADLILIKTSY